jgi:transducin (beta)-like 1
MARIWDGQGALKRELKEHTGPVFSLKWNRTGNLILSGSYDRRAIVWDAATGQPIKSFLLHSAPVLDVDWRDADTFATCSSDQAIYVCKVSSPRAEATRHLQGHTDEVNAVCWSPGAGTYLASCSDDGAAKIWSAEDGLLHDLQGHTKEIYTVRWTLTGPGSNNPDKPLLLCTASFDGTVKVWNATSGALVHNLRRQMQPVYSIAPSPNGEFLATGSLGGFVCVWSMADGSLVRTSVQASSGLLAFPLACSWLASLPNPPSLAFTSPTLPQVREMRGSGDTFDVSWSFDGSMLCSCFSSGVLQVTAE